MAYQQKLFLISALIIIGVGILAGIHYYKAAAAKANMEALKLDLLAFATSAQEYYLTPEFMNGGGHSFKGLSADFEGIKKLFKSSTNENGSFFIFSTGDEQSIVVRAIGHFDTDGDGENMTLEASIWPERVAIKILSY